MIADELCFQAKAYYFYYLRQDLHSQVPADILQHIALCKFCQAELDRFRNEVALSDDAGPEYREDFDRIFADHFEHLDQPVDCPTAQACLAALNELGRKVIIPTPITVHLDHCPACQEEWRRQPDADKQELSADTAAVRTRYSLVDVPDAADKSVEVAVEKASQPLAHPRWHFLTRRLLLRTGLAAAALLLAGFFLLERNPSAHGMSLDDLQQNLIRCKNIKISLYYPNQSRPAQITIYSASLQKYLALNGGDYNYIDLKTGLMREKNSSILSENYLSLEKIDNFTKAVIQDVLELPQSAESVWHHVDRISPGLDTYDLEWSTTREFYRYRFYVESKSGLPQRVEYSSKINSPELIFYGYALIEYLDDRDTEAQIQQILQ